MWHLTRTSSETRAAFTAGTTELLQSTLRNLILITGGVYLTWYYMVFGGNFSIELYRAFFPITVVILLTCALSLWLLPKQLLVAETVWLVGLAISIMLAIYASRQPEVVFLYALLPLMAVLIVGWPAGLIVEGLVIGLVAWFVYGPEVPLLRPGYGLATIVGGAFTGLLGWATTHTLLTVTQWSLFNFRQAQERMEEIRERQVELKQAQDDLLLANQELARLSDRLKALNQVAQEARRAKEEFVANVSHELRTPLHMIIGFAEMITQSPQVYGDSLPPALLADITAIQRNSQQLVRLVDDVLDLSQVEAGRMALSKEWVNISEIVDAATLAVHALFKSKRLYLETEIPPDLPPMFCDGTRVRQVIINLLSNAGRFTDQGGVRVKVWRETNDILMSVIDTGPGIAPEDQQKLFEPFQQLDGSLRRRHGGSGLGLSISKRFVEMHKGKMWLESEVGRGTTITFSLPLEARPPLQTSTDAKRWFNPYEQYEARDWWPKVPVPKLIPRFVLLDTGNTLQRLFTRYLDDVEICPVRDLEEAIKEITHSPAQALIVNTPSLKQGPIPLDQLNNLPFGTPILACWVPGEDEVAQRLGVVRYLVKPVTREILFSTLADLSDEIKDVLLVDDSREVLQLFARMFSATDHSYRVLRATDGQQALELLRKRRPDVMLLDLIMPGMDGLEVLEEKSQDPTIYDIPVIVISSRDPTGEAIVSDRLTITRSGGLSVRRLLACIQAISEVLSPSFRFGAQAQPEKPAAEPAWE
ncbi:MAG: hybrid sensor histidine kinase/response regulator [Anaerolineae bacterium]|nr:hybrid sensor histidine kinase/response regulator [Anaerolineae bacterium]